MRLPSLKRTRRGAAVSIRLIATVACTGRVALALSRTQARRTHLGRKALTLGTSPSFGLQAESARTVGVKVAKRYRSKLRRVKRLKARIVVACANAAGGRFTDDAPATLKG